MRRILRGLAVAVIAAAAPEAPGIFESVARAQAVDPVIFNVNSILSSGERQSLPIENERLDLLRYYTSNDARPLFIEADGATSRARGLIARMIDAEYDGLDPHAYPIEFLEDLVSEADNAPPERLAEIEIWFAAHFLRYAADLKVGRVLPRMVYPDLYMPRKDIDGAAVLEVVPKFPDLYAFFEAWEPLNIEYDNLRKALAEYLEIRDEGGWGVIGPGPDVAAGERDPRIVQLRQRLDSEYGFESAYGDEPDVLDTELEKRLRNFQLHNDVPVTGALDKTTLLALNVPVERRIEQIMLSMERLRWMPEEISDQVLIANKGDGVLRLLTPEGAAREWRILPNCPRENLALVAGNMRSMVLNPPWNVPFDYFQTNLYPELTRDPSVVAEQGYELLYQDTAMPLSALPWKQIPRSTLSKEKEKFKFRLRPGMHNPYGRYIYRLNGIDDAFLFDAPPETLDEFCDPRLPKGAIAVVDGLDLMDELVTRRLGPADFLERTIARHETLIVPDVKPLPVMIVFQSAWVDANGNIRFSKDPYLEDLRLTKALEGKVQS